MPFCSVLRASCRSCYWRIPGLRSLTQARHALGSFVYNPWPALFWESIRDLNGDHQTCLKKERKGTRLFLWGYWGTACQNWKGLRNHFIRLSHFTDEDSEVLRSLWNLPQSQILMAQTLEEQRHTLGTQRGCSEMKNVLCRGIWWVDP